uniref:Protein cramped-like n=1 Tax=Lepisosteus oculatus TaxID=7918 RepID=W5M248_LEPOC
MVRRKKTAPASEEHQNGVTAKPAEGSGDDGVRRWGRKLDRCEAEESEVSSAERDGGELLTPAAAGPSTSAPVPSSSPSALPAPGSTPLHQPTSSPNLPSQDQHHFLRSSVRPPSKRLRKDAVASAVNGHSGAKGKGAENGALVPVGCGPSGSPVGSGGATSKSAPRSLGPNDKEEGSQKKARRQWESWSAEDKNSFFEGLYEHGKDFEAIQNNIALKYKKKGKPASMVKNKEQVRHFYYRTWHKISKYIDFNNVYSRGLMKSSQELYGLICYAELRKKVGGCMDDKNAAKLNELIQHGATTVRYKGRNLRIKAPMCRALKKLCDPDGVSDEEDQKPVRLPLKVPVELQPRSNHSWARVQSLAHNPRLRMVVELHRKVSSLIEFLKQKWAVQDHRIRKSLEERQALDGAPRSPSSEEREELFLYPSESSTLTALPGVARVVHSKAFCTVHWLESGKCRPGNKELPAAQILGIQGAPRGPGRQGRTAGEPRRGESSAAEGADEVPQAGAEERSQEPPNPPSGQHTSLTFLFHVLSRGQAPELCSTATSPIKPAAEDPSLTPPGKIVSLGVRSPSCSRNQAAAARVALPLPGARNLPRTLLIPGPAGARGGEAEGGLFAIPTTLPPNSRHGKMFSPNKEAELAFRQQLDSISMQSDIFLPKQRKFRNRHLRKPLVVQERTLLPRTAGDTSQHVCSFSILSNSSATGTGSFRPIQSPLSSAPGSRPAISEAIPAPSSSQLSSTIDLAAKSAGIIPDSPAQVLQGPKVVTAGSSMSSDTVSLATEKGILSQTPSISPTEASLQNGPLPSPSAGPDSLLSPPNMSSLLDISLPGPPEDVLSQGEPTTHISDSIIELAISSAQYGDGSSLSPAKLNGSDSSKSLPSPASSPHRNWIASPTHDPQWYPSDSTDSSLGCLLSSLISPEKGRKVLLTPSGPSSGTSLLGPSLLDGSSRDSFASRALADVGEVDSQLACMMSENSVDYIARFNDLAQELSGAEPPPRPPTPPPQGGTG